MEVHEGKGKLGGQQIPTLNGLFRDTSWKILWEEEDPVDAGFNF